MKLNATAEGSTFFATPLTEILESIIRENIEELHVLFLTDGQDLKKNQTLEVSNKLKAEILRRNIYSKFSVIGIGEYEIELLNSLCEIGTERGIY